jgi:hypothetical protein
MVLMQKLADGAASDRPRHQHQPASECAGKTKSFSSIEIDFESKLLYRFKYKLHFILQRKLLIDRNGEVSPFANSFK